MTTRYCWIALILWITAAVAFGQNECCSWDYQTCSDSDFCNSSPEACATCYMRWIDFETPLPIQNNGDVCRAMWAGCGNDSQCCGSHLDDDGDTACFARNGGTSYNACQRKYCCSANSVDCMRDPPGSDPSDETTEFCNYSRDNCLSDACPNNAVWIDRTEPDMIANACTEVLDACSDDNQCCGDAVCKGGICELPQMCCSSDLQKCATAVSRTSTGRRGRRKGRQRNMTSGNRFLQRRRNNMNNMKRNMNMNNMNSMNINKQCLESRKACQECNLFWIDPTTACKAESETCHTSDDCCDDTVCNDDSICVAPQAITNNCCSWNLKSCPNNSEFCDASQENCRECFLYWIDPLQTQTCRSRKAPCNNDDQCCGDNNVCLNINTNNIAGETTVSSICDVQYCCSTNSVDCLLDIQDQDYCNYSRENCLSSACPSEAIWLDRKTVENDDIIIAPPADVANPPPALPEECGQYRDTCNASDDCCDGFACENGLCHRPGVCCSSDLKKCDNTLEARCDASRDVCEQDCFRHWITPNDPAPSCNSKTEECTGDSDCCGIMACVPLNRPNPLIYEEPTYMGCDVPMCCSNNNKDCLAGARNSDFCNANPDNCNSDECSRGTWIDRRNLDEEQCTNRRDECTADEDCCGAMTCQPSRYYLDSPGTTVCEFPPEDGVCCSWGSKNCNEPESSFCDSSRERCERGCNMNWIHPHFMDPMCRMRLQSCNSDDSCCGGENTSLLCLPLYDGGYNGCDEPHCCSLDGRTCMEGDFCNNLESNCRTEPRCSGGSWIDRRIPLQLPGAGRNNDSSWEGPFELTLVPAAAANLVDGKLLLWSAYAKMNWGGANGFTWTAIFDPATNNATESLIEDTQHDMFCPGTAVLPDGRVMITGGSNNNKTTFYNPLLNEYTAGPEMIVPRGYHSMTVMTDGSVFAFGGSWSGEEGNKTGEVWTPDGGWELKPGLPCEGSVLTDDFMGVYRADNHMWLFTAPNGLIFQAGPSARMNWIDTEGQGRIIESEMRGADDAMNGNAIMFDIGKILVVGGAPNYNFGDALSEAYVIDLNGKDNAVTVEKAGDLNYPRGLCNSVVLPSGEVVVIGGMTRIMLFSDQGAVFSAELWDPATRSFTVLSGMQVPRTYHSVALLMKDGRVWAGGGGLCGDCRVNHADAEILSPPYLFDENGNLATRPVILSAPELALPGDTITVTMQDAEQYSFALVRLSASTHSVNNDLRRIPLEISSSSPGGSSFDLSIPDNPSVTLAGSYYLFAMNGAGVPSVATTVLIPALDGAGQGSQS